MTINIEISEQGVERMYLGTDTDEQYRGALRLLEQVAPQMRELHRALQKAQPESVPANKD